MLALYHKGDAVCPIKVRIALAEKGLDWESRLVDDLRDPVYLALNPSGVVPTLVHDDRVLVESRIISEYLEDAFPTASLMPQDAEGRHRVRLWSKQVDDSLHLNVFVLSFLVRGAAVLAKASPEVRDGRLPKDPLKRRIALDIIEERERSPWVKVAVARFGRLVGDMDEALAKNAWLAGPAYTLADADLTAYLHRLEQLGLDRLWRDKSNVLDWRDHIRKRPSYDTAVTAWLTEADRAAYVETFPAIAGAVSAWLAEE